MRRLQPLGVLVVLFAAARALDEEGAMVLDGDTFKSYLASKYLPEELQRFEQESAKQIQSFSLPQSHEVTSGPLRRTLIVNLTGEHLTGEHLTEPKLTSNQAEPKITLSSLFPSEVKEAVTDEHNKLRSSINFPCTASDMSTLVYDDDLALYAHQYAQQCHFHHDPRNQARGWGENIGMVTGYIPDNRLEDAVRFFVDKWYSEIHDVDWSSGVPSSRVYKDSSACRSPSIDNPGKCMIGHFTQTIWASSTHLGCGYRNCPYAHFTRKPTFVLICKYTKPGNLVGNAPFIQGARAAACAEVNPLYEGLCAIGSFVVRCEDEKRPVDWDGWKFDSCSELDDRSLRRWCNVREPKLSPPGICARSCHRCVQAPKTTREFCGVHSRGCPEDVVEESRRSPNLAVPQPNSPKLIPLFNAVLLQKSLEFLSTVRRLVRQNIWKITGVAAVLVLCIAGRWILRNCAGSTAHGHVPLAHHENKDAHGHGHHDSHGHH